MAALPSTEARLPTLPAIRNRTAAVSWWVWCCWQRGHVCEREDGYRLHRFQKRSRSTVQVFCPIWSRVRDRGIPNLAKIRQSGD